MIEFDVTVSIGPERLRNAGIDLYVSSPSIIYAIRSAVEQVPGVCWAAVEVHEAACGEANQIEFHPRSGISHHQRRMVEDAIELALVSLRAGVKRNGPPLHLVADLDLINGG